MSFFGSVLTGNWSAGNISGAADSHIPSSSNGDESPPSVSSEVSWMSRARVAAYSVPPSSSVAASEDNSVRNFTRQGSSRTLTAPIGSDETSTQVNGAGGAGGGSKRRDARDNSTTPSERLLRRSASGKYITAAAGGVGGRAMYSSNEREGSLTDDSSLQMAPSFYKNIPHYKLDEGQKALEKRLLATSKEALDKHPGEKESFSEHRSAEESFNVCVCVCVRVCVCVQARSRVASRAARPRA